MDMSAQSAGAVREDMSPHEECRQSSDRSFGFTFTVAFLVVALFPLLRGSGLRSWALAISAAFLILTLLRPALLRPLNRLWARFGLLLSRVTTPLMMGVLFFFVITPVAVIFRLWGKDPLRLRADGSVKSYWIRRIPPGPTPASMSNQF
jgi:hypothetical protein